MDERVDSEIRALIMHEQSKQNDTMVDGEVRVGIIARNKKAIYLSILSGSTEFCNYSVLPESILK